MKEYKARSIPKQTSWQFEGNCYTFKRSHIIVHVNPPLVEDPKGYEIFVGTLKLSGIRENLEEAKMLGLIKAKILAQQTQFCIEEELEKMTSENPALRAKVNMDYPRTKWDVSWPGTCTPMGE